MGGICTHLERTIDDMVGDWRGTAVAVERTGADVVVAVVVVVVVVGAVAAEQAETVELGPAFGAERRQAVVVPAPVAGVAR